LPSFDLANIRIQHQSTKLKLGYSIEQEVEGYSVEGSFVNKKEM